MESAVVLLSGGQDSATCLVWTMQNFDHVHTVSFQYGQKHEVELDCAKELSKRAKVESHTVIPIQSLSYLGDSALIGDGDVNLSHRSSDDLPASFVPGRNLLFLTLAGALAFKKEIHHLVTGTCQTDFSGYPDCRDVSLNSFCVAISLAMDYDIHIHTPLMWKTKAETIYMMRSMGYIYWYKYTHTCYEGVRPGCGHCPSCLLRAKGFKEAGIFDPLFE